MKGFGRLIRDARVAEGMSRDDLAARIGRTRAVVYRIEEELQEPAVDQLNSLVSALPLSAETLLKAMGLRLTPPEAARLPRDLVQLLVQIRPENRAPLLAVARGLLLLQQDQQRTEESPK